MYKYSAVAERVISGDTLVITVDLGFRIKHTLRVKLNNFTAPQGNSLLEKEYSYRAKMYLKELVMNQELKVVTYKKPDNYTVDIWVGHSNISVVEVMNFAAAGDWS